MCLEINNWTWIKALKATFNKAINNMQTISDKEWFIFFIYLDGFIFVRQHVYTCISLQQQSLSKLKNITL